MHLSLITTAIDGHRPCWNALRVSHEELHSAILQWIADKCLYIKLCSRSHFTVASKIGVTRTASMRGQGRGRERGLVKLKYSKYDVRLLVLFSVCVCIHMCDVTVFVVACHVIGHPFSLTLTIHVSRYGYIWIHFGNCAFYCGFIQLSQLPYSSKLA